MKNYEAILLSQAVGKTVKHVAEDSRELVIVFTDDTALTVKSGCDECDDGGYIDSGGDFDPRFWQYPHYLVSAGIITESDAQEIRDTQAKARETQDRETYERLKRRFEAVPTSPKAQPNDPSPPPLV